jgi:glycine cleavage system H protein
MLTCWQLIVHLQELQSTPGKVNEAPFGAGWFIKIKVSGAAKNDFEKLLDEAAYKKHCDEEEH